MRVRLVSALAIVLGYAALQYFWLPPDGFFAGDCASKYLQARAVLTNGPLTPWIEGPALDIDTALRWHEPVLIPRDGHLVGQFSWIMPLLGAPFLGLFGLRGLYVVPAIATAVTFLAAASMGRTLGQRHGGLWSGLCAALATPLLVYGAELWEHAPAVALSAVATALLVKAERIAPRDGLLAAAALVGAFSLRPETIVVGPAVLLARALTFGPKTVPADARALLPGGAIALAVLAVMNYISFGGLVPQHIQWNVGEGLSSWGLRRDALDWLLLPKSNRLVFGGGLIVAVAAAFLPRRAARRRTAQAGIGVMLLAALALPLWQTLAAGRPWSETFGTTSVAQTWPAMALLLLFPVLRPLERPQRLVALVAALTPLVTLAVLSQTGGAQWSARFFLSSMPPAAVLAVELVRRRDTRVIATAAIVASFAVQVYGLTHLRYHKRINAQITHITAAATQSGDIIVSDLYWFPQVTVTLYPTRRLLFAPSRAEIDAIAARAAEAGFRRMWVVAVTPLTGYTPPSALAAGFVRASEREAGIGSVTFHQYVRHEPVQRPAK